MFAWPARPQNDPLGQLWNRREPNLQGQLLNVFDFFRDVFGMFLKYFRDVSFRTGTTLEMFSGCF